MNPILWILALIFASPNFALARVRKVEVKQDQIVAVRTAIGIATIIQVPDRPNSVVVGDQSAFKVEYLDQAITIKPLHSGGKSNLYVYTDYRRYNVQLLTGPEAAADYVVYLQDPKQKVAKSGLIWNSLNNRLKNDSLNFHVLRAAKSKNGILLIEFKLQSTKKEELRPEWIWLTQGGVSKPIHGLFLTGLDLRPNETVTGVMQILKSDVSESLPMRIELRRKKTSYLTIPKVSGWK